MSAGEPNKCVQPATSANASSMEIRSTAGREIVEHRNDRIAEPLVFVEMAADKDELLAQLARAEARHAARDPEGFGFVGSCEHNPATNGDRLSSQRRVEQLLDRGIKGVQVRMENGGFHSNHRSVRNK